MPDFFDEIALEQSPDAGPETGFFDELMREDSSTFTANMELAKRKAPEEAARHYDTADKTGLPVDYVERNEEKLTVRNFDYDAMRKRSPILADMLKDQRNAEVAQEELDNLSWFEEAARETKNIAKVFPAAAFSVSSASYGILAWGQGVLSSIPRVPIDIYSRGQDLLGFEEAAEKTRAYNETLGAAQNLLLDAAKGQAEMRKSFIAKPEETRMHPAVIGGVESAIINVPALAASVITKNPNVGLSLMGGVSYGSAFTEGKTQGLTDFEAFSYASGNAIAEVVTEKIPMGMILKDISKNTSFVKLLGKQMIAEGATEQVATVWQDANKWAAINPEKTLAEFMQERPEAAYNTLIATMVATGLQTSAISGINKLGQPHEAEVIERIVERANESNYRSLDKANFETYLQEVSEENGSVENIYIDAKAAREAFEEMNDEAAIKLIGDQLEEAEALNGDIVIPIGEFASTIAVSPDYAALRDSLRVTPDAEVVTVNAFDRIQEANKSIERKDQSKKIFKEVFEQLKDTGMLTQEQAKLSAEIIPAFLGANPERMGLTVEEAYEMMGLKIVGPTEDLVTPEQAGSDELTSLVQSFKQGEDTLQAKELRAILESQGIDANQDAEQIVSALSSIKEFKQPAVQEEVIKSDPLVDSQEWRDQTVTATLDDGGKEEINAGQAYDIIQKRKEDAQSILDCINANP